MSFLIPRQNPYYKLPFAHVREKNTAGRPNTSIFGCSTCIYIGPDYPEDLNGVPFVPVSLASGSVPES